MKANPNRSTINPLDDLRGLAREPDWRAMEVRLLEAFDERVAGPPAANTRARAWWHWAAAAAGVVLAAAVTFYVPSSRFGAAVPKSEAAPPTRVVPAAPVAPVVPVAPVAPVAPRAPRQTKPAAAARPATGSAPPPTASSYNHFVALPAAFALPELESGRIVRMEVPLTMLPVYGLDLVPEAAPSAVQADFLIGQDGVLRAIRLAANSPGDQRP